MFATKLPIPGRRVMTMTRPFAMRTQQAVRLGKPMVFQMLTPAPVRGNDLSGLGAEEKKPNAWDATNSALNSLTNVIGAGTNFYSGREETKRLQQQADMADAAARAAQQKADTERQYMLETQRAAALAASGAPKPGLPSWVLPVAIGGVVLAAVGGYFLFKKKA